MSDNAIAVLDKEDLRETIAEVLDVPATEVTDEAHFVDDLEVDSLLALEITVVLEQKYGVKIDESELKTLTSLHQAHDLLLGKLQAK